MDDKKKKGSILPFFLAPIGFLGWYYARNRTQKQHSVLRNYPFIGKARYVIEKAGPELRQYLYDHDNTGKPFNRREFGFVYTAAKYDKRQIGYGSQRNFDQDGLYMINNMFPKQRTELRVEQYPKILTKTYQVDKEALFHRNEHRETTETDPFYLPEEDAIILGEDTARQPFKVKGLIGQSAMSFGSLGDHAISALSLGLGMAGGTWMNTGEGSISKHHQKGDVDIIMQISPGLFGVRTADGDFSWEEFKTRAQTEQIKAFEIKLAQGGKTRGGHVDGSKITPEIAEIRDVEPYQDINSPNRFDGIDTPVQLLQFLDELRNVGGKPVGIKIVVGDEQQLRGLVEGMKDSDIVPDFITVDGGEGGSGATYYELAESVGLPSFSAVPMVDDMLQEYGLRERTKMIASGKLITPDKIAMALALGADMVNIARGFMLSVGCVMSQICHTNNCPVGVATTDPDRQKGLVIDEKKYRVCNYLLSIREGLFEMAAVAGIDSPTKFNREHIVYKEKMNQVVNMDKQAFLEENMS
ncbi:FMN-binding glutamate synthase family protein [Virgibacillus kekensis]|uniref:FMN-binding glutamate synthase family protein n=1 Tax=Virgibacillus kekensis TaxID=202261 RepID=A0ABV9DIH9_9BACI